MKGPWLRPKDAASYMGMSYKSFDAWVRKEGVPHSWIGRHRRFAQPALDRVMEVMAQRKAS